MYNGICGQNLATGAYSCCLLKSLVRLTVLTISDTLAWATGTRVGATDHAIALFVFSMAVFLGLYSDKLHFEVLMCALLHILLYMWL